MRGSSILCYVRLHDGGIMQELSAAYATRGPDLKPFFSYFGSKFRTAKAAYPAPVHRTIIEPFAGGAAYALRYFDRRVVLCDLDPVIAGMWRYLTRASEADILALPDLEEGQTVLDLNVSDEARWLIGFWLRRAGTTPVRSPTPWMRSGKWPQSFWGPAVRAKLARQVRHIRHWVVMEGSYEVTPAMKATWFIDPPYTQTGSKYRYGSRWIDYEKLGDWCRTRPGQVIVCEMEGADWLPFRPIAPAMTRNHQKRTAEVMWLSDWERSP